MIPRVGHNGGPSLEGGKSWRTHAWGKARAELLPKLPIEVVRGRVKRAKELGLPYKTYAGIRASTGQDLIGFLFSTNALRMHREARLLEAHSEVLDRIKADRTAIVHRPVPLVRVQELPQIDASYHAPLFSETWSDMRDRVKAILKDRRTSGDRYILVAETEIEREWVAAGGLAGMLSGHEYFGAASEIRSV